MRDVKILFFPTNNSFETASMSSKIGNAMM